MRFRKKYCRDQGQEMHAKKYKTSCALFILMDFLAGKFQGLL